jgi:ABC-2 type transport system permease protein
MALGPLLHKEGRWLRRHAGTLVVLLILVPSLFAVSTVAFQQVIPRDTPVGVVAADEDVTEDEMAAMTGVAAVFSRPATYQATDHDAAMRALDREEVYALFYVPHGVLDSDASVTIRMVVAEEMVPYEQPSFAIANILRFRGSDIFPADIAVERETTGQDRTLSEFLVSVGAMVLVLVLALGYLPRVVAREKQVFRRVRVHSSLWPLLTAKLLVFLALLLVALGAFQAVASYLAFDVWLFAPGAVLVTGLTFLYLAAIGVGIMFLSRFRTIGQLANVALIFGVLAFSNLVYPTGFFSPLRREIARSSPLFYSMVVQRGTALKGNSIVLYSDYILGLVAVTVLSLLFLAGSVRYYSWRGGNA